MPITYREKLKVLHDTFINYILSQVERLKMMDQGFDVYAITNTLKDKYRPLDAIPVVKDYKKLAFLAVDLWNCKAEMKGENVRILFSIPDNQLKLILSEAIQKVAFNIEETIDEAVDLHEVGFIAAEAVKKLFNKLEIGDDITSDLIAHIILRQDSLFSSFSSGDAFSAMPPVPSKNYFFISEEQILEYFLTSREITLCEYLRMKYGLNSEVQIIFQGEVTQIKRPSYLELNGYEFDTDIFRLDRIESRLKEVELKGRDEVIETSYTLASARLKKIYSLQDKLPKLIEDDLIPVQEIDDYLIKLKLMVSNKNNEENAPIGISQLFMSDAPEQEIEKILVVAEPGMGKKTLIQSIAYNWGKNELFKSKFKYVFKVNLKLFFSGWLVEYSVKDLRDNLLKCFIDYLTRQEKNSVSHLGDVDHIQPEEIFKIIDIKNRNDILFLLNGYDDLYHLGYQPGRIKDLIDQLFSFKYFIVIARPNSLSSSIERGFDRKVQILGFSYDGSTLYIERFFNKQSELLERAIKDFFEAHTKQSLMSYFHSAKGSENYQIYTQLKKIKNAIDLDSMSNREEILEAISDYYLLIKTTIFHLIKDNINIREFISSPLELTMLCLVGSDCTNLAKFREDSNIIKLYQEFILYIGKRYLSNAEELQTNIKDISLARIVNLDEFKILKLIAHEGFANGKAVIDGESIESHITSKYPKVDIRKIYKFGLLKTEGKLEGDDLLKQAYLFLHSNFQEFLNALFFIDQIADENIVISKKAVEFISYHRNEQKYLSTLKFMAGLIEEQSSSVAVKFWEAILCNVDRVLEIGTEEKLTLLMHLLKQTGVNKEAKGITSHKEAMVKFIDNIVMVDFLRWTGKIKSIGYLSQRMLDYIITELGEVDFQIAGNSQFESSYSERSELECSPPDLILSKGVNKKVLIDLLYSLVNKFAHYQLYDNKAIFYKLKPYLLCKDWRVVNLCIQSLEEIISVSKRDYLERAEIDSLLVEVVVLIENSNIRQSSISLIGTLIKNQGSATVLVGSFKELLQVKIGPEKAIAMISQLAMGGEELIFPALELLIFNVETSNYIDCCSAIQEVGKLPSYTSSSSNFIKTLLSEVFSYIRDDDSINYRILQAIEYIILENEISSDVSEFIKGILTPYLAIHKKTLSSYLAMSIISQLDKPIKKCHALLYYHKLPFLQDKEKSDFKSALSKSIDSQNKQIEEEINSIELSLDDLILVLSSDDYEVRFLAAKKICKIMGDSDIKLKISLLEQLQSLLNLGLEEEYSAIIYVISKISCSDSELKSLGLEILEPLLRSENFRISYSSAFAVARISQEISLPHEIAIYVISNLIRLLEFDDKKIVNAAISGIGNIAAKEINHNPKIVDLVFEKLLHFFDEFKEDKVLSVLRMCRHQTYPLQLPFVPPMVQKDSSGSLQEEAQKSTRQSPVSQPIIESDIMTFEIESIEDIIPTESSQNDLSIAAVKAIIQIVKAENYQVNKNLFSKFMHFASLYQVSPYSLIIITELMSYMSLKKASKYLQTNILQIRQITIEVLTIKLKGELIFEDWYESVVTILKIIGTETFDLVDKEKNLHIIAKKQLKQIVQGITDKDIDLLNINFNKLIIYSTHTPFMMKDIYHIILIKGALTQQTCSFIVNCITELSFTITIDKMDSKIFFEGRNFELSGESDLKYWEEIAKAAVTKSGDLLSQQYTSNEAFFPNTGSIKLSASDIKAVYSIINRNRLTVDIWEISALHNSIEKIIILEKRNYFGEHEIHKISLIDERIELLKYTVHPHKIREIRDDIISVNDYIKYKLSVKNLKIEEGYKLLSLVDVDPISLIKSINDNDFSLILDSHESLMPLPKKFKGSEGNNIDVFCVHQIEYNNPPLLNEKIDYTSSEFLKAKSISDSNSNGQNYKTNSIYNKDLLFFSFTSMRLIESSTAIKYFFEKILRIDLPELPAVFTNEYLWILAHNSAYQTACYSLGVIEFYQPSQRTINYAAIVLTTKFIDSYSIESGEINTFSVFIDKCAFSIAIQTVLGASFGMPLYFGAMASIQCYYSYNTMPLIDEKIAHVAALTSGIKAIAEIYYVDSHIIEFLPLDKGLFVINSMVFTHQITTIIQLTSQEVINMIGDIYDYYSKNGENDEW